MSTQWSLVACLPYGATFSDRALGQGSDALPGEVLRDRSVPRGDTECCKKYTTLSRGRSTVEPIPLLSRGIPQYPKYRPFWPDGFAHYELGILEGSELGILEGSDPLKNPQLANPSGGGPRGGICGICGICGIPRPNIAYSSRNTHILLYRAAVERR
jgi:hypothetical protein